MAQTRKSEPDPTDPDRHQNDADPVPVPFTFTLFLAGVKCVSYDNVEIFFAANITDRS
jgi:hypothetical protein